MPRSLCKRMAASMVAAVVTIGVPLLAQEPNPAQRQAPVQTVTPAPIFRVEVVQRSTPAINYLHRGGSTKVDFAGTPLMAAGKGEANVESQRRVIRGAAHFKRKAPPSRFGPQVLK